MIKTPEDMISGTVHKTKKYGDLVVTEYHGAFNVHVKFLETDFKTSAQASNIRMGNVRDKLLPCAITGRWTGVGSHKTNVKGSPSQTYSSWDNMFSRCYSEKYHTKCPTYIGCTVHSDWLNFQVFAKWFDANFVDGYHLDKDLLVVGNKVYSKDTCIFVPSWLNGFTTDHRAKRGEFPIGVTLDKRRGTYQAKCCVNGKSKHIGTFNTPEAAHAAWLKFKLNLALSLKSEMDAIHPDIYDNVIQIIQSER